MKKIFLTLILAVLLFQISEARNHRSASIEFFFGSLSAHGEWIEIDHDVVVWRPNRVHYNWIPYSVGRWAWTNHGWYWDSYEPFGWATYHYGRWFYEDYYGWVWLPDYEWGPSWVEWRYNDNYVGWSPLPPYARFKSHSGIHFSIQWNSPYHHWRFVNYNNFCNANVHNYYISDRDGYSVFQKTKYRTNYYSRNGRIVNGGIDRQFVERRGGSRIAQRELQITNDRNNSNGRSRDVNGALRVYRPSEMELNSGNNIDMSKVKKSSTRTSLKTDKIVQRDESAGSPTIRDNSKSKSSARILPSTPTKSATDRNVNSERSTKQTKNESRKTEVRKTEVSKSSSAKNSDVTFNASQKSKIKTDTRTNSAEKVETNSTAKHRSVKDKLAKKKVVKPMSSKSSGAKSTSSKNHK
ncbi:MAG: hypothetical protein KKD86_02210 [Bacteroidetes bacterium]|nr:hypothetical protein [Bacteroidota bacterium]MBU1677662.1 hypothetical protein [Bacteroidota bacterium]